MKVQIYVILFLASYYLGFAANQNVNLIANVNDYPQAGYTDVWGYAAPNGYEYVLLGVNGGVSIIDVTDQSNIMEVDSVSFVQFGWYDIKTYQNYMYVSTEGSLSILIVDLSPLPDSVSVVGTFSGLTSGPHNIFVDTEAALLYIVEDLNVNPSVRIFSLADPENPIQLSTINPSNNGKDAHDIFAQDSILYIAEGVNPSIGIYDVSNPANPTLIARQNIPNAGYVHQVWVTENNKYMVTTEETAQKTIKIWDVQDLNNITLLSEYIGGSQLAHNAYFKDSLIYVSHYESGLKVLDYSDPTTVVEVASYDTYPQGESPGFNGAWGVYPFTQNGMIFVSDMETGLYVLELLLSVPHALSANVSKSYLVPGMDSLFLTSKITNPDNHNIEVKSIIESFDQSISDTIQMYDDGFHHDSTAGDDLFGGSWTSPSGERLYKVGISTFSLDSGNYNILRDAARFTTIGPVLVDHFEIPQQGANGFTLRLYLRNDGLTATATVVRAKISTSDTNVLDITSNNQNFGNLGPGQINSSGLYNIFTQNNPSSIKFSISISSEGWEFWSESTTVTVTGIAKNETSLPKEYRLEENYPNPFNPTTSISYQVPHQSHVRIEIYNMLGQKVRTLLNDRKEPGEYKTVWDGRNDSGVLVGSGIYLYRMVAGDYVKVRKMILMK